MPEAASGGAVSFGPFEFDPAAGLMYRGEQEVLLPPRAAGVLAVFLGRPGEVLSKDDLLREVWKEAFVGEDSLTQAISMLRHALGDDARDPTYIQTVPKRGYRFIAEVRVGAAAPAGPTELDEPSTIASGARLGHYEILDELGAGAMGTVYRARDVSLDREVAIKVPSEGFVVDNERLARFEREAKLMAAVSHPNIAAIYGLEQAGGVEFPVLELVEGETLAERIASRPIPVSEALELARQIAAGLEAAHERGIVHRDLKPANIKITPTGQAKVLDFGLAKALEVKVFGDVVGESPTESMTIAGPKRGAIVGTAAYMSPEQARGQEADRGADIWAFGCVLFEMLTGKRAFGGETVSDTVARLLEREPDLEALPPETPPAARRVLRRCLTKDPTRRLHDVADARIELEEALAIPADGDLLGGRSEAPSGAAAAARKLRSLRGLPWAIAAAAVLVAGALWLWDMTPWAVVDAPSSRGWSQRFSVSLPENIRMGTALAVSPDGMRFVFNSLGPGSILYLLEQPEGNITALEDTEGARSPFFSPEGDWIGFRQEQEENDGRVVDKLKRISTSGGAPYEVCCDAPSARVGPATWAADDTIIFLLGRNLVKIPAFGPGTNPDIIAEPAAGESYNRPQALPGGHAVIFSVRSPDMHSPDDERLVVLNLDGGQQTVLSERGSSPAVTPTGFLLYLRYDALRAVRFGLDTYATSGPPFVVRRGFYYMSPGSRGTYAFSDTGTLAYIPGPSWGLPQLTWVARDGERNVEIPAIETPLDYGEIDLSPNRQLLLLDAGWFNADILVWDLLRNAPARQPLTWDGEQQFVTWMPDNEHFLFRDLAGGVERYYLWSVSQGQPEPFLIDPGEYEGLSPVSVSPDGKWLATDALHPETGWDLMLVPLDGERELHELLVTEADEERPEFSPDGQLIAYVSDFGDRPEIYVMRASERGKQGIRVGPGNNFRWGTGSDRLYYFEGRDEFGRFSDELMAVSIRRDPQLQVVDTTIAMELGDRFTAPSPYYWDIDDDGRGFVSWKDAEVFPYPTTFSVVLNWFEELERLAAGGG